MSLSSKDRKPFLAAVARDRGTAALLLDKARVVASLERCVVVAVGSASYPLASELADALKVESYNLFVREICLPGDSGEVVGAVSAICGVTALDSEAIARLRVEPEQLLEAIQTATRAGLEESVGVDRSVYWVNAPKQMQASTALLVDSCMIHHQTFVTAIRCLLFRGVKSIVPVTPFLLKSAVLVDDSRVKTGIYAHQENDILILAERASQNGRAGEPLAG